MLQSCPTLCDPIDRSLPGSPVPGILQARTLEWVAISFSRRQLSDATHTGLSPPFSHPVQTIVKSRLYPRLLRAKKPKSLCPCLLSRLKYTQRSFCRLPERVASTSPQIPLDAQRYPPKGTAAHRNRGQTREQGQRRDHQ